MSRSIECVGVHHGGPAEAMVWAPAVGGAPAAIIIVKLGGRLGGKYSMS